MSKLLLTGIYGYEKLIVVSIATTKITDKQEDAMGPMALDQSCPSLETELDRCSLIKLAKEEVAEDVG